MTVVLKTSFVFLVYLALVWSESQLFSNSILSIGHRGAPYFVPEHTLASYSLSIREGIDYIEPDLVATKDGVLVAVHDLELSKVTNVVQLSQFSNRKKSVTLPGGVIISGWFVNDFTLEEIKSLRVKQRVASRDHYYDYFFTVPTFEEILALVKEKSESLNISVGVYLELKHPHYFEQNNLDVAGLLIDTLTKWNYSIIGEEAQNQLLIVQCFESTTLKNLKNQTDLRLIQLIDLPDRIQEDTLEDFELMLTPTGLDEIKQYAEGIGPHKYLLYDFIPHVLERYNLSNSFKGASLVQQAHSRRLLVHPWTFTNQYEDPVLVQYFDGGIAAEYEYILNMGVDGFFTEFAGIALCTRKQYLNKRVDQNWIYIIVAAVAGTVTGLILGLIIAHIRSKRKGYKHQILQ